jgi:hypothetical protein
MPAAAHPNSLATRASVEFRHGHVVLQVADHAETIWICAKSAVAPHR